MKLRQHNRDCGCYVVPPARPRYARETGDITDIVSYLNREQAGAAACKGRRWKVVLKPGTLLWMLAVAAIVTGAAWLPPGVPVFAW